MHGDWPVRRQTYGRWKLYARGHRHTYYWFSCQYSRRTWFPFSVLTLLVGRREGHPACKKLDVGLLVVMIWLELWTAYSSSCHHHFRHLLLQWIPANPGSPGRWPLKWRERDSRRTWCCRANYSGIWHTQRSVKEWKD